MAKPVFVGMIISFLVLLSLPSVPAHASPVAAGTDTLTLLNPPTRVDCADLCYSLNYKNNLDSAVSGLVYSVVHNLAGQTVSYMVSAINLGPGQNVTAYFFPYHGSEGLPDGSFRASFFVVTPSGIVISTTSTICFTTYPPFDCP